jgi:hypothetical protein
VQLLMCYNKAQVAKVEAVYRALAQAAASGAQLDLNLEHSDNTAQQLKAGSKRRKSSSSSSSSKSSKQSKRQRKSSAAAAVAAVAELSDDDDSSADEAEVEEDTVVAAVAEQPVNPLTALITAYFDGNSSNSSSSSSSGSGSSDSGAAEATASDAAMAALAAQPLPLQPLSERAAGNLRRDAAVLLRDPSFRGLISSSSSGDSYGYSCGSSSSSSSSSLTAAPHAWLLKDGRMLATAAARVFHSIGSTAFPASRWRQSVFWGRYREHSFADVRGALLGQRIGS